MVLVNYVTIHTSEMKDCVKAGGLLDYLYWTQTDSDAADMATADAALALLAEAPDVALVDYHLHDRLDGLGVVAALRAQGGRPLPAALLTGDGSDALKLAAREHGCAVLTKPVKPASLRAFLAAQRQATNA